MLTRAKESNPPKYKRPASARQAKIKTEQTRFTKMSVPLQEKSRIEIQKTAIEVSDRNKR